GTPIILISIDTLRSDRLPVYGYRGVATPHIDAFRGDSILYERAYSHCPLTLPSHASMFTGLLPSEHGVRDNIGYRLAGNIPTAAEVLKKSGYATGAAISAFVLRREAGLARGFDFYDDEVEPLGESNVIGRVQRPGNETIAAAEQWLEKTSAQPFFLFLHLYDPHTPYEAPQPFLSQYEDRYDGEIAWVDHLLGKFFESLKRRGLYDRSMIVVTSDHGEGLNDHGEEEHGIFLYREVLQVPLLLKLPRSHRAGSTVKTSVQLIDLFPTILERVAASVPKHDDGARSLLSFLEKDEGRRRIYAESYYPRFHFGWSDLHSLIDGDHHYIRAPIPELYNLASDPGEKKNVLEEERRTYFAMREAIEPFVKRAEEPAPIDPEDAARFAALGYVGSNVSTTEGDELPDPKTTVDVFRQIRLAYTFFRDYRLAEALALTDDLLEDNERIVDLWDLKSKILGRLGRVEEAVEAARSGLRHQPQSVPLIITVANLSILIDELEQAEKHAELLLGIEPPRAHDIMARVAIEREDYDRARAEAEKVLKTGHDPSAGLMLLGLIDKQRNDLAAALGHLNKAVEGSARKKRPPANLHLYRGDVLARLGRTREAEQAFRREIAAFPSQTEAYASLILLLAAEGRVQEATRLVFDVIRASPTPPGYVAVAETLQAIGDEQGAVYWTRQGLQKYPDDASLRRLAEHVRPGVRGS
ncbi:MAG TPA: sulfatase-like hydrolase/transferase, partial [Thermoanaerobaculia bacterium]|nr:sulfatase-like hydrolase/transferase [Thermoanaerobaculia bacterium]